MKFYQEFDFEKADRACVSFMPSVATRHQPMLQTFGRFDTTVDDAKQGFVVGHYIYLVAQRLTTPICSSKSRSSRVQDRRIGAQLSSSVSTPGDSRPRPRLSASRVPVSQQPTPRRPYAQVADNGRPYCINNIPGSSVNISSGVKRLAMRVGRAPDLEVKILSNAK